MMCGPKLRRITFVLGLSMLLLTWMASASDETVTGNFSVTFSEVINVDVGSDSLSDPSVTRTNLTTQFFTITGSSIRFDMTAISPWSISLRASFADSTGDLITASGCNTTCQDNLVEISTTTASGCTLVAPFNAANAQLTRTNQTACTGNTVVGGTPDTLTLTNPRLDLSQISNADAGDVITITIHATITETS